MKVRESGMPEPTLWETFFDPAKILNTLGLKPEIRHVVEFGCGYGTFTIPAAQMIKGKITCFEIDKTMVSNTRHRVEQRQLDNVEIVAADFEHSSAFLSDESADYVMLFNILHGENAESLLHNAHRVLHPGTKGSLIHWNHDPETPRGPPMAIRPTAAALQNLARKVGFDVSDKFDLPPYHYGFIFEKPVLDE